jgi:hypothetical protein
LRMGERLTSSERLRASYSRRTSTSSPIEPRTGSGGSASSGCEYTATGSSRGPGAIEVDARFLAKRAEQAIDAVELQRQRAGVLVGLDGVLEADWPTPSECSCVCRCIVAGPVAPAPPHWLASSLAPDTVAPLPPLISRTDLFTVRMARLLRSPRKGATWTSAYSVRWRFMTERAPSR